MGVLEAMHELRRLASHSAACERDHGEEPCCPGCAAVCGEPCHWACLNGQRGVLDDLAI